MLVSRISRRVLAEHHLALSTSFRSNPSDPNTPSSENVGIIYTNLSVKSSIEHCLNLLRTVPHHVDEVDEEISEKGGNPVDVWPEVIIDGHQDTRFSYIKEHLDYIVFEILKNVNAMYCCCNNPTF